MKKTFILGGCLLAGNFLFAQGSDTATKQFLFQAGYVSEYVDGGGAGLSGFEGQARFLFKKQRLAKGQKLGEAVYANLSCAFFGGNQYSLNQMTVGLGLSTPLLGPSFQFDFGLGATRYSGTVDDKTWSGKKIDLGGHIGMMVPFGRSLGLYGRLWMPGIITSLSDDTYISPMFIVAGIQF